MKLPILNIPLVWFAAVGSFLAAIFFALASVNAARRIAHPDLNSVSSAIVFCASVLTLVCSVALACRKNWARKALIWLLFIVAVLLLVMSIYDVIAKLRHHEDLVFRLVATLIVLLIVALLVAFLLNQPLVREMRGEHE